MAAVRQSVLLVVSGPSGAGKDTLIERLRQLEPDLTYCVAYTTRPRRSYEIDGIHYRFATRDDFAKMEAAGEFLETFAYSGNMYGTPRRLVEDALQRRCDLILKPEVNGARAIKSLYPKSVLVFVTAPSTQELARRLEQRHSDNPSEIDVRLQIAEEETAAMAQFDYRVLNDDLERAVSDLRAILVAERLKVARLPGRTAT